MVCPYRQAVKMDVQDVGGKIVVAGHEEYYPECYGNDCPYYIYSGRCAAIEKDLAE